MKIPTQANSRFLAQIDVRQPIILTMDHVSLDATLRNPYVLHFADKAVKPLVLNVTNRRVLVSAFGDDDVNWRGRQIEVYVNPDVTNSQGEITGGLRVRVPTNPLPSGGPFPRNGTTHTPPAASLPTALNGPLAPQEPSIDDKHKQVLAAFAAAKTETRVAALAHRAAQLNFAPHHVEEQSDAYHAALDRIAGKTPALVDSDIPF